MSRQSGGAHPRWADEKRRTRRWFFPWGPPNADPERRPAVAPEDQAADRGVRGWTIVHSYFAAMGGFAVQLSDENRNFFPKPRSSETRRAWLTITPEELVFLEKRRPGLIPVLSRTQIEDKSKGSMLAKSLVCFQATWFCVQCLARFIQHLTISLLELNTFAHALCTLLIYCLWWHKPLDVEEPELILVQADMEQAVASMCTTSRLDQQMPEASSRFRFDVDWNPASGESWIERRPRNRSSVRLLPRALLRRDRPARRIHSLRMALRSVSGSDALTGGDDLLIHLGETLQDLHFYGELPLLGTDPPDARTVQPRIRVARLDVLRWKLTLQAQESQEQPPPDTLTDRIRNFPRFNGIRRQWQLYLGFSVTGLVYGGLHALAWNAPFHTHLERLFWRMSSVTISATGVLVALVFSWDLVSPVWKRPVDEILEPLDELLHSLARLRAIDWVIAATYRRVRDSMPHRWRKAFEVPVLLVSHTLILLAFFFKALYDLSVVASVIFYTLARAYFVLECFLNLVHLPDSAYLLPQWSQYVPHIA